MNSLPLSLRLDRSGLLQVLSGLVIALIALLTSYDHINISGRSIRSSNSGASLALLPRWRSWLS
jgi:hypothetical protein